MLNNLSKSLANHKENFHIDTEKADKINKYNDKQKNEIHVK
jgi:hypothetical protein